MDGGAGPAPRLAVVLKGYPRLSETFIAQELLALQSRGHRFDIWSLRAPYDGGRTHPIHGAIRARVRYLPEYLHDDPLRVLRGWRAARLLPGYEAARAAWRRDLARDGTRNRVRRWGQALVLAAELPVEAGLIYAHFLHTPGSVARYAALLRGLPWGVSAHAKDIWTTPEWEKREKLADAAFCVTCTEAGAAHLRGLAPEGRVGLVYHGLDLARFPPPPSGRPAGGPFTLLSVGRLVAKKGYDDLLAALARLPEGFDWRLVHVGGGELSERLAAEAARLGLSDRIEWRGKRAQDDVIAAMRVADLFVLPSKIAPDGDRDGLPNVLMEAAAQGLPILSTAISAIPEFVTDGVHGRLVPSGDPVALAEAIVALAGDPAGRRRFAEAAYARLTSEFGMTAGIDRLEARLATAMTA
ncbi:MAG TPA: glycosyltransferase family 4 protein [Paracoccaceae bacterium]|nr:glycosyltransferase family 4 protein [Paracoccaceae bacterium]